MPWFSANKFNGDKMQWWYRTLVNKYPQKDQVIKMAYANCNHGNFHVSEYNAGLYEELEKWLQSQGYIFEKDLKKAREWYTDVKKPRDYKKNKHSSGYPYKDFDFHCNAEHGCLMPPFANSRIDFRVRVITNLICGWADKYNEVVDKETLYWPNFYKSLKRHEPFLSQWINTKKMKKIAYKVFTS